MKLKTSLTTLSITAGIIGFFSSGMASAVPLTTAGDYALPGTTVAAEPQLAGTVIEDLITNFSITGAGETLSGTIQNRVIRSAVDGTLDFSWRIRPEVGNGDISAFRVGNFEDAGFLSANWRIDGLGDAYPETAKYFGPGSGSVNFIFERDEVGLDDNPSSHFFFLDTDAIYYDMSGEFDLLCEPNNCISQLYKTFAPSQVPLPGAVWLLGSGLLTFFGLRRRKASAQA